MSEHLAARLERFFRDSSSVLLFAGAGVSVRAGLVTWPQLIRKVAEACRPKEPHLYHSILEAIDAGELLRAADRLWTTALPRAQLLSSITDSLKNFDEGNLECIARLPFRGAITTNYDRSLLHAFNKSRGVPPVDYFYPDSALAQVAFDGPDFFVARIHGRVESPASIVLTQLHYDELARSGPYEAVLRDAFSRRNLLFVGFSFLDPAINFILRQTANTMGDVQPGRHLALLPKGGHGDLSASFSSLNIETFFYETENDHRELWDGFCSVAKANSVALPPQGLSSPFDGVKRYLSACWARFSLGKSLNSLRETVVEGIVAEELRSSKKGCTKDEMVNRLSEILSLTTRESAVLFKRAVEGLSRQRLVEIDGGSYFWNGSDKNGVIEDIELLAKGVANRVSVQSGVPFDDGWVPILSELIEELVLRRGWDLGVAFASRKPPEQVDVSVVIQGRSFPKTFPRKHVKRAIESLIINPQADEASALANLGRLAFGLELILKSPRDGYFLSQTLPSRIYLDANVLMPAITEGHPYRSIYDEAITSLITAANRAKSEIDLVVHEIVLEEIVSHRRKAIDLMRFSGKNERKSLTRDAFYYGTENLNVFVAGYSGVLARGEDIGFDDYLSKYAPYRGQNELRDLLRKRGYLVISEVVKSKLENYPKVLHELQVGYIKTSSIGNKEARLIDHDALQLAKLMADIDLGKRSLFVTADRRLRNIIGESKFSNLSNAMVSHVGLANLVDLIVGIPHAGAGTSKLIWGAVALDKTERMRNFLLNTALRRYQESYSKAMGNVIDDMAEDIVFAAEREQIDLDPRTIEGKAQTDKFLDQYEPEFFDRLRKAKK